MGEVDIHQVSITFSLVPRNLEYDGVKFEEQYTVVSVLSKILLSFFFAKSVDAYKEV